MHKTSMLAVVVVALPLLALALPAVAKPKVVKLRFVASPKKESRWLQLPLLRRSLTDGVPLQVGGKLLGPTKGGADGHDLVIGGATYAPGDMVGPLRVDGPDGKPLPHQLRVIAGRWQAPCLMADGAMVGKLGGTRIALIDANLNGRYDDYGADRMAVGRSPLATPLSRQVSVGKTVYRIEVAPRGDRLTATALEGVKWGQLELMEGYEGRLKPELMVFQATDAEDHVYVRVGGARAARVPRGSYRLTCGALSDDVWVEGDPKAEPFTVGFVGLYRWGGPYALRAEVRTDTRGRVRSFTPPAHLKAPILHERVVPGNWVIINDPPVVVGRAGERYVGPYTRQDRMAASLADPKLEAFSVVISADRQLNAGQETWKPWDMSGLVQKVRPYWLTYEFDARSKAGEEVTVTVKADSPLFGKLTSEPVTVRVPR